MCAGNAPAWANEELQQGEIIVVDLQARVIGASSESLDPRQLAGVPEGHPSHRSSLAATSIHSTTTGRIGSPARIRGHSQKWTGQPATQAHEHVQG